MGKNNPIQKIFKKSLVSLILAGSLFSPLSCRLNYEEGYNSNKEKFYIPSGVPIIYEGDSVSRIANVHSGVEYEFHIDESNDGARDTISVYVDDVKLGEHLSPEGYNWGEGWDEIKPSPNYRFKSNSDSVELRLNVDSADMYGYWPHGFDVELVNKD